MVVVGVVHDDVPAVEAVLAPIGDDVAGSEALLGRWVAEPVAPAAAVHTHDVLGNLHASTVVPGPRYRASMRVIAGELGGRTIRSPKGSTIRPTSDRVREAIFNTLFSLDAVDGAEVTDLFAGTGALGIEALSRGAAHCTFVDRDADAVALIESNLASLDLADRARVVRADALVHARRTGPVDLVLADPPYRFEGLT